MPKTIDYPRTSYTSAWEVAEVVDDTGGKCAIETAARKLNRKVSGSFKAIIGSAVKFGLLTSKRELLTTTNLFRRIKHAYDKQEERIYHREAFLHPPLFTQICRKFRNRELPVHMLDVMLLREFGVEEINAQGVAKAFIDGARMVSILDERNIIVDIDQLDAQQGPRKELSKSEMPLNLFKSSVSSPATSDTRTPPDTNTLGISPSPAYVPPQQGVDPVSSLFGLDTEDLDDTSEEITGTNDKFNGNYVPSAVAADAIQKPRDISAPSVSSAAPVTPSTSQSPATSGSRVESPPATKYAGTTPSSGYSISISGPGLDTQMVIEDAEDLILVSALLDKIRRQLR
ncbi:hypothetical protein HMJ29_17640 [Hymenobacter taeanensis]|uniref:Uncharacterized protein n=1 Tax=Hymenobacter taeanensis TaxID=2735321 RepID=A0A6M6BKX9_9BACT|nr:MULTISPECIES: hypothetical protein [Hymenobacter]QJX48642.1 hypothetical protein HMJ29_17640 [Hymenobacter taeanensis]UOQ81860.1 hypothetical protein MUN83_03455 [Hymenobacter sp. 5414T-23]